MPERLLLCTDLDRTLIPNGPQPQSPGAHDIFAALVKDTRVVLAYVTGRHRQLLEEAMEQYGLPQPDFITGDVGTTIDEPAAVGILEGIAHYHPALRAQVRPEAME